MVYLSSILSLLNVPQNETEIRPLGITELFGSVRIVAYLVLLPGNVSLNSVFFEQEISLDEKLINVRIINSLASAFSLFNYFLLFSVFRL